MLSIIIPVFNEENRLEGSLDEISRFIKKLPEKTEILIVNDGSSDLTGKILARLTGRYSLEVINHPKNMGKGAAIKTGIKSAKGDYVLFTDIDLSVPIEFAEQFLEAAHQGADVVIGTRAVEGSKVEVRQFWLRELLGEAFTFLTNLILWVGVSDFTCGFKLFRKEAAQLIFNNQRIGRWAFDAESLFLARRYHFKIKELPVVWRHREGSKVKFPQDLIQTLIDLLKIRYFALTGSYKS